MWAKTGIASMRDAGLAELPEELWAVAQSIRVSSHLLLTCSSANQRHAALKCLTPFRGAVALLLWPGHCPQGQAVSERSNEASVHLQTVDVSCNRLPTLPPRLASLRNMSQLQASHNLLELDSTAWDTLGSLIAMTRLMLDHNR